MAHINLGGWFLKKKLFVQVQLANELWYDTNKDGGKFVHFIGAGWWDYNDPSISKLFTITILWVNFQIGTKKKIL